MTPQWAPPSPSPAAARGMEEHLAGRLEVAVRVVEDGHVEQAPPVVLEHGVVGHAQGRPPGGGGHAGQRPLGPGLVLGRAAEHEGGAEGLVHAVGGRRVRLPRLDGATDLGGPQGVDQGVGGETLGLQLLIGGDLVEERVGGEVARQQAEAPAGHLGPEVGPFGDGPQRLVHQLAPQVGGVVHLDHGEGHRAVDGGRQPPHPVDLLLRADDVLAGGAGRGQLEDPRPRARRGRSRCRTARPRRRRCPAPAPRRWPGGRWSATSRTRAPRRRWPP